MARVRNYAAEYARRLAKGKAAGRTRQQSRGHIQHEHVARAIREREERGISSAEEKVVRRWGEKRAAGNKDLNPQDIVDWTAATGYAQFKAFRRQQEAAHRQYVAERKNRTYLSRGMRSLAGDYDFDEDVDLGDLEIDWLYYH